MSYIFDSQGNLLLSQGKTIIQEITEEGYCVHYQSLYDNWTNKPSEAVADLQNTMVEDLIDEGMQNRMDLLYITAQYSNDASEACSNWINQGTWDLKDVAATDPSWNSLIGYFGNSGDDFLSCDDFNPSTDASNYTKDSATMGVWIYYDTDGGAPMGARGGGDYFRLYPKAGGDFNAVINSGSGFTGSNSDCEGLNIMTRRTAGEVEVYRNYTSLGTGDPSSTAMPNAPLYFLACSINDNGSAYYSFGGAVSIAFVMDGVTDADVSTLTTIFKAYMDGIKAL